jgi:16S rRNA (guanine966-N2)-methyltransferase
MQIIGGQFKGRNILPPPGRSITRPITGWVKKSLFSILGEDLSGQIVLDLYCGTGTLGLEAISRGAVRVGFAEKDRRVVDLLRRNIREFGVADRSVIWSADVETHLAEWLAQFAAPIDVAFLDPPYAAAREWDWPHIAQRLFDPIAKWLAPGGVIILRLPGDVEPPQRMGAFFVSRSRLYGDMLVALYSKDQPTDGQEQV